MNCYLLFLCNCKHRKVFFTLGKAKLLFFAGIYTFIFTSRIGKNKKKKRKKEGKKAQNSCFIKLLSSQSLTVLITALSISPFIFQKHITLLFECSLMLHFDLVKLMNYKWSSQKKKYCPPKNITLFQIEKHQLILLFPPLRVSKNSLLLLHCISL